MSLAAIKQYNGEIQYLLSNDYDLLSTWKKKKSPILAITSHFWVLRETIGQLQGRTGKWIYPIVGKCFGFISRMPKEKSRSDNRQMICEFKVWKAICSANALA